MQSGTQGEKLAQKRKSVSLKRESVFNDVKFGSVGPAHLLKSNKCWVNYFFF